MVGLPQRGVSPAESYEGVGPKFTLFPTEPRRGDPGNRLSVVDLLRSRPQIGRSMHPRARSHAPSSPPRRPIFASGRAARGRQSRLPARESRTLVGSRRSTGPTSNDPFRCDAAQSVGNHMLQPDARQLMPPRPLLVRRRRLTAS